MGYVFGICYIVASIITYMIAVSFWGGVKELTNTIAEVEDEEEQQVSATAVLISMTLVVINVALTLYFISRAIYIIKGVA